MLNASGRLVEAGPSNEVARPVACPSWGPLCGHAPRTGGGRHPARAPSTFFDARFPPSPSVPSPGEPLDDAVASEADNRDTHAIHAKKRTLPERSKNLRCPFFGGAAQSENGESVPRRTEEHTRGWRHAAGCGNRSRWSERAAVVRVRTPGVLQPRKLHRFLSCSPAHFPAG